MQIKHLISYRNPLEPLPHFGKRLAQVVNTQVLDHVMFNPSLVQVVKITKIKDEISFKLIISKHRYACVLVLLFVSSFLLQITRIVRYSEPKSQRIEDKRSNWRKRAKRTNTLKST